MQFLDFEKPLEDLQKQLDKLNEMAESSHTDMSAAIREIEAAIEKTRASIYQNLSPWQRVQLSRHPERPYTQFYIESIFENFTEYLAIVR